MRALSLASLYAALGLVACAPRIERAPATPAVSAAVTAAPSTSAAVEMPFVDELASTPQVVFQPVTPLPADVEPLLGVDEDPPGFARAKGDRGTMEGPARSTPVLYCQTPLASLPTMGAFSATTDDHRSLELNPTEQGYRLVLHDDLLAEVNLMELRVYTWSLLGKGDTRQRAGESATQVDFGKVTTPLPIAVRGIHMHDWTASALSFLEFDGTWDHTTHHGAGERERMAPAKGLWPAVVYSFVEVDNDGKPERLALIAPTAAWVASPVSITEQLRPHVGSFTYVEIPLRGGAASAVIDLTDPEISGFGGSASLGRRAPHSTTDEFGNVTIDEKVAARVIVDVDGETVRTSVERLWRAPALASRLGAFASTNPVPDGCWRAP
jgi:hypothetical protein